MWRLDRLGRTVSQLLNVVDDAGARGVEFVGFTEAIDTSTASGKLTLATGANERGHELGGGAPGLLLCQVAGVAGRVELEMDYVPRTCLRRSWT